jgi:hypothetical protein
MIVRELLAVFGLEYDDSGEKAASRGIINVRRHVDTLQAAATKAFAAAAVATPFVALGKFASDAQEQRNLLEVVFQSSAQDVLAWSNTTGEAMGRSRYLLRDLAADFGGLVGAMVGPGEQASEMSMKLAELAVDLTSIRNLAGGEKEALTVLQSAMAAETEAIKRFGVDLTVAAQEQEALSMGLGKSYQQLNKQEKAQIRFNILMRDLAYVQGDAAKTVDQFAGSWRRFKSDLLDVAVELGSTILPGFEWLLGIAHDLVKPIVEAAREFREWAKDTNLAKGALIALGLVLTALVLPALLSMLPFIAAFGLLALAIDDVITFMQGGESVIGHFVAYVKDLWGSLLTWLSEGWENFTWSGLWETIKTGAGSMFGWLSEKWGGLIDWLSEKWGEFRIDWSPQIEAIKEFFANAADKIAAFIQTPVGKIIFAAVGAYAGKKLGGFTGEKAGEAIGSLVGKLRIPGSKKAGSWLGGKLGGLGGSVIGAIGGAIGGASTSENVANLLTATSAGLRGSPTVQQGNNTFNFDIQQQPGQKGEDLAKMIGEEVTKALDNQNLDVLRELVPAVAE